MTVFVAELGDKTQIATLLFAADAQTSKWLVFFAASTALIMASAVGVLAGAFLSTQLNPELLSRAAGVLFILIGLYTLFGSA
jgi:putative Ca2+/H+ antiporter (TMEM165/GDT1 family)